MTTCVKASVDITSSESSQTLVHRSPSEPIDLNSTISESSPRSGALPIPPPSYQKDNVTSSFAVSPPKYISLEVNVSAQPCASILLNTYG